MAERPEFTSELFKKGLQIRREVLGEEYVSKSIAAATDFNAALQQQATENAWGAIWTRPGLDRKTRSMLNLAMLSALNRSHEFKLHIRGALNNGVTRDEIKEVLLQVGGYCGVPAAVEAFRLASEVFKEVDTAKSGD
jgi:4-carboxymuconolactone decarboxylase